MLVIILYEKSPKEKNFTFINLITFIILILNKIYVLIEIKIQSL